MEHLSPAVEPSSKKQRRSSLTTELTRRNTSRKTTHPLMEIKEQLSGLINEHLRDVATQQRLFAELREKVVGNAHRYHEKLQDFDNALFSTNQSYLLNRSVELKRSIDIESMLVSNQTKNKESSADRMSRRLQKTLEKESEELLAELVADPVALQTVAQNELNLQFNVEGGTTHGSPMISAAKLHTTKEGTTLFCQSVQKFDYLWHQRVEMVEKIIPMNLSIAAGGVGKQGKKSEFTLHIENEAVRLAKFYKSCGAGQIKKWIRKYKEGGASNVPGTKKGPARKISDTRFVEVFNEVRRSHLKEENAYTDADVDGLLFAAQIKTAQDKGTSVPTSVKDIPQSTHQTYVSILRPFLLKTQNAQSKASTENRAQKGQNVRMILTNATMVGCALTGACSFLKPGTTNEFDRVSASQGQKKPMQPNNCWNADVTGYTISNTSIKGRDTVVVAVEDRNEVIKSNAKAAGLTQTIKHFALSSMGGSTTDDVILYRNYKTSEVTSSAFKGGKDHIYKAQLPWLGGGTCHVWQKNSKCDLVKFNYELIDELLFPMILNERAKTQGIDEDTMLRAAIHRGILITDGEQAFVDAMKKFMKTTKWKEAMFSYGKFSPCTSGVPSGNPLDQCKCACCCCCFHFIWFF